MGVGGRLSRGAMSKEANIHPSSAKINIYLCSLSSLTYTRLRAMVEGAIQLERGFGSPVPIKQSEESWLNAAFADAIMEEH